MVFLINVTLLIYLYVLFTLGQCLEAPARAGPQRAAHTIKWDVRASPPCSL